MKTEERYRQALELIVNFNGDMSLISGIFQIKGIAKEALMPGRKESLLKYAKQAKPQKTKP